MLVKECVSVKCIIFAVLCRELKTGEATLRTGKVYFLFQDFNVLIFHPRAFSKQSRFVSSILALNSGRLDVSYMAFHIICDLI